MTSPTFVFFGLGFTFFMCLYWLGVFFIMYHLIRFGVGTAPKKLAAFFLGGALVLSLITTLLFTQVNFNSISTTAGVPMFDVSSIQTTNVEPQSHYK